MQKQSTTLAGQWSNLMDNIKTLFGNAGQDINNITKDMLSALNTFMSENWNSIKKTVEDVFVYVSTTLSSLAEVFASLWVFIGE